MALLLQLNSWTLHLSILCPLLILHFVPINQTGFVKPLSTLDERHVINCFFAAPTSASFCIAYAGHLLQCVPKVAYACYTYVFVCFSHSERR